MDTLTNSVDDETLRKSNKRVSALISQFNNFQQNPALATKSNSFRIPSKIKKVDAGQKNVTRSQSMSHKTVSSCDTRDNQVRNQKTDKVEMIDSCEHAGSMAPTLDRMPPLEKSLPVESPSMVVANTSFVLNTKKEMLSKSSTKLFEPMETSTNSSAFKPRTVTAWSKLRGTIEKSYTQSNTTAPNGEDKTGEKLVKHDQNNTSVKYDQNNTSVTYDQNNTSVTYDQNNTSVKQATGHSWRRQQFSELAKQASLDKGPTSSFNSPKLITDSVIGSHLMEYPPVHTEHTQDHTINIKQTAQNLSLGKLDFLTTDGVNNNNSFHPIQNVSAISTNQIKQEQNVSTVSTNQIKEEQNSQLAANIISPNQNEFRSLKIKNISFGANISASSEYTCYVDQSTTTIRRNSSTCSKPKVKDSIVHTHINTEDNMSHDQTMTSIMSHDQTMTSNMSHDQAMTSNMSHDQAVISNMSHDQAMTSNMSYDQTKTLNFNTGGQTKTSSSLSGRAIKLHTLYTNKRTNDVQQKSLNSSTIYSSTGKKNHNCINSGQVKLPTKTKSTSVDDMSSQTNQTSEKTKDAIVSHNKKTCTGNNFHEADSTTENQSMLMDVHNVFITKTTPCLEHQTSDYQTSDYQTSDYHLSGDIVEYIPESRNLLRVQSEPSNPVSTVNKCDHQFQFDVQGVHNTKMEYCLATDRINRSLVKLKTELMSMHEQDLILLKQLINISQTIQKLQRSRVLRMSKSLSFSNGLLHPQPLHMEKRSYSSSLVRQNSAPFNIERRRQLFSLMRASTEQWSDGSVSSFDESEIDSQSEMEESAPSLTSLYPYLSPKSTRSRPMFQYKSSQMSLCVAEDPDQTYEDILKRNIRLWKMNLKNQQSVIEEVTCLL